MGTSMRRYAPPMGTAGFARCLVSGYSRVPAPPPRMMAVAWRHRGGWWWWWWWRRVVCMHGCVRAWVGGARAGGARCQHRTCSGRAGGGRCGGARGVQGRCNRRVRAQCARVSWVGGVAVWGGGAACPAAASPAAPQSLHAHPLRTQAHGRATGGGLQAMQGAGRHTARHPPTHPAAHTPPTPRLPKPAPRSAPCAHACACPPHANSRSAPRLAPLLPQCRRARLIAAQPPPARRVPPSSATWRAPRRAASAARHAAPPAAAAASPDCTGPPWRPAGTHPARWSSLPGRFPCTGWWGARAPRAQPAGHACGRQLCVARSGST
jgi:hypothetical protein